MENLVQNSTANDAMIVLDCSDNGGEFSETEDMLEGIRNVVQKVQETVDTDTNEELCPVNNDSWFPNGNVRNNATAEKANITMPEETLDAHDIHIQNGGDSFLLLLSKDQFHDSELLPSGTTDSTLLKPLHSATCEQLVHVTSLDASTRNPEAPEDRNLQPVQTLNSTAFPLLSSVDTLTESHAASFRSGGSLPISSILELSNTNTTSKISVASFASSHCGQISDLNKARLLKHDQKTDNDDEEREDAPDAYEQMQLAGIRPLEGEISGSRQHEHPLTNYQFSDDDAADASGEHFTSEVQDNEEEEDVCLNDKELLDASASSFKLHKYLCTVADCGRWFNSKTAFTYHQLQHTGERPYKCQTCQKCFFTCSALKVHERLHSGEKPYKCEECGHLFRQWGDLKYHKISKHSNEKSHKCEFCGKEFARRYSLVLHRRIHTNEKNFVCEYCNKAFRASSYLQSHRMIHTGEKPHQCNKCDKKFRCHGDLNRHQKTHSRVGKMEPALNAQEKN
uniref:C2H2-type domain-containing protein n=1 Tax=Anopheles maculatus TaxID=74869 RepID=A0A182T1G5_9DIPT